MGKNEVEKLVGSVYKGNWLKNVAASVIALSIVLAVCIAVARLGDPFPYDGMAWFVPVYYLGRVLERPGLLILCMLLAITVGFAVAIRSAMTPRRRSCRGRTGTTDTFRSGACL